MAPESGTRRLKRAKRLPTNGSTDNGPVEEDKTAELAAPYSNGAGGSRISHKLKKATGSVVGGRQKSPARDGSHGSALVTEVAEPSGVAESHVAARGASRPTVWPVVRDGNRPWPWIWSGRLDLRVLEASLCLRTACRVCFTKWEPRRGAYPILLQGWKVT